jgi:hypothetical protein
MTSSTSEWHSDFLARAVNSALLRGRCVNQCALVATGAATEADVRRMLMFWLVQRTMITQPDHRLPSAQRAALERQDETATDACTCDREPPSDQELSAV